jgi:ParB family chromosome partitioning protein
MNHNIIEIETDKITIKRSVRENYGDLQSLVSSIQKLGLIYPVIIDKNNILISGNRRIEACRESEINIVPAIKLEIEYDSPEALEIQADDNLCRLPLTSHDFDELINLKKAAITANSKKGIMSGIKTVFTH